MLQSDWLTMMLMVASVQTELYEGWLSLINETKCDDGMRMTCVLYANTVLCGQPIRQCNDNNVDDINVCISDVITSAEFSIETTQPA